MNTKDLTFKFSKSNSKEVKIHVGNKFLDIFPLLIKPFDIDKIFIIADSTVYSLHGESLNTKFSKLFDTHIIIHQGYEKNKNLKTLTNIINSFFELGGTSHSCIITLGGGITGNMGGLASAMIYRGVKLVHIPTTLLAQLDSAPDVKQSVNSGAIKNAIGAYKAPDVVLIDTNFLTSLSERELLSGIAEATKHAFAQDLELLEIICFKNKSLAIYEEIIVRTIDLKITHWKNTPTMWNDTEQIERLTHLGHTVGKVLEMIDLDHFTHGEAISHGMIIEFYAAYIKGYMQLEEVIKARTILSKLNLLKEFNSAYTADHIMSRLFHSTTPIIALLHGLGSSVTSSEHIDQDTLSKSLNWYLTM